MGKPYCADIITNNSAQHSSNKIFWSLTFNWVNDWIDFVHFTAKNNNLAAVSNTISWLLGDDEPDPFSKFECNVKHSSELLTSSSLPSIDDFDFGKENAVPDDIIESGFEWFLLEIDLNTSDAWIDGVKIDDAFGSVDNFGIRDELAEINGGGGGGKRFELAAAAKCENESNIFEWMAPNCA